MPKKPLNRLETLNAAREDDLSKAKVFKRKTSGKPVSLISPLLPKSEPSGLQLGPESIEGHSLGRMAGESTSKLVDQ